MPEYRALYRKYRPQGFSEIVGQNHVTETLAREVVADKVAHAYLFAGPRGTGKTTTARILAKALNCPDRRADGEPCNVCVSCIGITEGSSMDVIELDAASHNKVEDVRDIRANVGTVASVGGARRVYILDEAHMLSRAAANALLKTLEEPPEHAHFVLATTEPYKLPDTIRSRTQRFDFHPIGSDVLVRHLQQVAAAEGLKASHEGLALIARHASGSARDALGLMEQVAALGAGKVEPAGVARALGLAGDDAFVRLIDAIATTDAVAGLTLVANLASSGADLRRFVADGLDTFRGLFLAQYAPNLAEIVDESAERLQEWRDLAKRLQPSEVLRCIDRLALALADLREGREERLVVELTVLQMCRPETAQDVAALTARVDRLEERLRRVQAAPSVVAATVETPEPAAVTPLRSATPEKPTPTPARATPAGRSHSEAPFESAAAPPLAVVAAALPPIEGLTLEAVQTAWPAAVARIREEAGMRRFALFREARPAEVTGATIVLEVAENLPFHLAQLSEDDALNATAVRVLGEVLGGAVRLVYRGGSAPVAVPLADPLRAPDQETLSDPTAGGVDPAALMADLLDGEVVE
ncbi:MAG: DNA polymerase III subunit gamma/tau [Acidimicrobiia bacterium]|nr:DNA polymerase III subunit gamma/tau [Acidimicrobiia bacterium]